LRPREGTGHLPYEADATSRVFRTMR
jgi:hypothetical protein